MLLPHTFAGGVAIVLVAVALQFALVAFTFGQRRRRFSAEKLFADNQERLALLSSISSLGFWSWDAATDRVWASTQARGILGLAADGTLLRGTLLGAIHPDDRAGVLRTISVTAGPSETLERELRVVGTGGEIRWITAKACVHRNPKGAVLRAAGYVVDDSQRKRAATELLKLQEKLTHLTRVALLGELSGALAHELQQPLTAILCNAQAAQLLVAKEHLDVQELSEILREIVSDDKHAGQVIQRLRALLMRGETQFARVDIEELLRDVLSLARGTLMERNVQVSTRIEADMPGVQGDRVELQQVLLNLVLNACESMSGNSARDRRVEIVISLAPDQESVRTSVLDCGGGIDGDRLERVFEPFFTTKAGGMGLGLAISQSIISAHGGRLWATNRSDRGAAFHFTLPVVTREEYHERRSANCVHS
ncbi:MAG TPA: ATP-binding protein [Steroidobacteraceae bacterium]|nr:ATP-binding protein [Steroidobacteraceae bacterium]